MTPQWTDAGLARLLNDVEKEDGMDNERELLELAAKAAGMDYLVWTPGSSPIVPGEKRINGQMVWNPIHDDGDAFRLAVRLGIEVGVYARISKCAATTPGAAFTAEEWLLEGGDHCAATRRAIVRAAAELGRAKS